MAGHSQNSQAAAPPHRFSMPRSGASSSGLTVTVDLSSVLLSTAAHRRALHMQCITIPAGMTDLRKFEALLRAQPYVEKGELRPEVLVEPELREGEVVMVFQVRILFYCKELFERQKRQAHE